MSRYYFGEWIPSQLPLTQEEALQICGTAQRVRHEFRKCPLERVYLILDELKKRWSTETFPPRVEALRELPIRSGFSSQMIELGLNELGQLLDPALLSKKVDTELGKYSRQVGVHYDQEQERSLHWSPLGTLLHVLSGNVFLVGPGSLLEGLLTGNVSILKMPSSETYFLPLFVQTLMDAERDLFGDLVVSKSIALVDYSSQDQEVIAIFKKNVDGIVVWGGEEAVRSYRKDLPSHTPLIIFGPKLSFSMVTRRGCEHWSLKKVAKSLAFQISLWDQNACTAPQVCFVEGDFRHASLLAEELSRELKLLEAQLACGELDLASACEIRKLRTLFEISESQGDARLLESSHENLNWTLFVDKREDLEPSPLHRTLRLIPYQDFSVIENQVQQLKSYIQTVGVVALPQEQLEISSRLSSLGALRIVDLDHMAGGDIDDPHDGAYDLPRLMNLITTRIPSPHSGWHPIDSLASNEKQEWIHSLWMQTWRSIQEDPFYQAQGITKAKMGSLDDLCQLPILSRARLESYIETWSHRPLDTALHGTLQKGGYVTRSGGSTGASKFSYFNETDWNEMIENATRIFRVAGLQKGDRIANCFLSGDLYGSFVSFDHVNARLGLTSFCFANKVTAETFLEIWNRFDVNVIEGVPTTIMPILRSAHSINPNLCIEKILFAGQPMSKQDRLWLKEALGAKRISSIIGTTEAGQIGYQCEHQSGKTHHVVDDYNHLEFVDDQGSPVAKGQPGRILVTTLTKRSFPLLRYDIGDSGILHNAPCPCGRNSPIFDYLGRKDDIVCIGLVNFSYRDLVAALEDFDLSEIQLVARYFEQKESLLINIETVHSADPQFKTKIYEKVTRLTDVREQVDQGNLHVEVQIHQPGSLERRARTGKLPQILDLRE